MTDLLIENRWVDDLDDDPRNTRTHSDEQIQALARIMIEFGPTNPILIDERDMIIAGHARKAAVRIARETRPDLDPFPTILKAGLTPAQRRALVIADNRIAEMGSAWNLDTLKAELTALDASGFDLTLTGFAGGLADLTTLGQLPGIEGLGSGGNGTPRNQGAGSLSERFGIPPFSVLNAREGWWQDRKRAWIAIGIKSELGRGEGATYGESDQITEPAPSIRISSSGNTSSGRRRARQPRWPAA